MHWSDDAAYGTDAAYAVDDADADDALMLLMCWCYWGADAADALMLLMILMCWSNDAADALMLIKCKLVSSPFLWDSLIIWVSHSCTTSSYKVVTIWPIIATPTGALLVDRLVPHLCACTSWKSAWGSLRRYFHWQSFHFRYTFPSCALSPLLLCFRGKTTR